MTSSIFPVEIIELIVEDLISQTRDPHVTEPTLKFVPHWQHHLTPLFRVCKSWHMISERLMYQRVSLGSDFFRVPQTGRGLPKRRGHWVARKLLETLTVNSRIATHVKELRLAIHDVQNAQALECTRSNLRILQLCPNVKYVEIRGFHHSTSDALVKLLKTKSGSLVSLCVTPHSISTSSLRGSPFKLLDLMEKLPQLRTIKVDGLPPFAERNGPNAGDAPGPGHGALRCCPDLQEIQIVNCALRHSDLESLRGMSDRVRYLSIVTKHWSGSEALLEGLCGCLCVWSRTLQHLSLRIDQQFISYRPFREAISTLKGLQRLEINGSLSDFSAIADLPSLERLRFKPDWMISDAEMGSLISHLDDLTKFPALKHVSVCYPQWEKHDKQLHDICIGRGIQLETRWHENHVPSYLLW